VLEIQLPRTLLFYLGDPPVLPNENLENYWKLTQDFGRTIDPKNDVEWIWIRDLTDLTWEIVRYR
jgi:hypothetical protein